MRKKLFLILLTVALLSSLFVLTAYADNETAEIEELAVETAETGEPAAQVEEIAAETLADSGPAALTVTFDGSKVTWSAFMPPQGQGDQYSLYFVFGLYRIENGKQVVKRGSGNNAFSSSDGSGSTTITSPGRGTWIVEISVYDSAAGGQAIARGQSEAYVNSSGGPETVSRVSLNIMDPVPGNGLPGDLDTDIDVYLSSLSITWYASDSAITYSAIAGGSVSQAIGNAPDGKYLAALVEFDLITSGDVFPYAFDYNNTILNLVNSGTVSIASKTDPNAQKIWLLVDYGKLTRCCTVKFNRGSSWPDDCLENIPSDFSVTTQADGYWTFTLPSTPVPSGKSTEDPLEFIYYTVMDAENPEAVEFRAYKPGDTVRVQVDTSVTEQVITVDYCISYYVEYEIIRAFIGVKPEDLAKSSYSMTVWSYDSESTFYSNLDMSGFVYTLPIKSANIAVDNDGITYATWTFTGLFPLGEFGAMPEETGMDIPGYIRYSDTEGWSNSSTSFELYSYYYKEVSSVALSVTAPAVGKTPDFDPVVTITDPDSAEIDEELGLAWWVYDPEKDDWFEMDPDETFELGKIYGIDVMFWSICPDPPVYRSHSTQPVLSASAPVLDAAAPALSFTAPVLNASVSASPFLSYFFDENTKVTVNGTRLPCNGDGDNAWFMSDPDPDMKCDYVMWLTYSFPKLKETTPTNPPTGDDSHTGLWLTVTLLSASALTAGVYVSTKKKKAEK